METQERHEQNFVFPSPEHGIKGAVEPEYFLQTFYRYSIALSFATELKKRDRYLDFGSGCGWGCELISAFFGESFGVDRDPKALDYSRKVHSRAGTKYVPSHLMAGTGPFDLITFYECIEHMSVEEGRKTVKYLASILDKDGYLIVTTPISLTNDGSNEKNPFHIHEYHPGELKMMLLEFFKDVIIKDTITGQMALCKGPR